MSLICSSAVAAYGSLNLLVGVALGSGGMPASSEAFEDPWYGRGTYVCAQLAQELAEMLDQAGARHIDVVARALRTVRDDYHGASPCETATMASTLLDELIAAVDIVELPARGLVIVACVAHALTAMHELAAEWESDPAEAADGALTCESLWAAAIGGSADVRVEDLAASFALWNVDAVARCQSSSSTDGDAHLHLILQWLEARAEREAFLTACRRLRDARRRLS